MGTSPSQKWEDGKLVERAQDARGAVEENTAQPVAGRTNDTPVRNPEPAPLGGNTTFAERAKARSTGKKVVEGDAAENKAVSGRRTQRKANG